MKSTRVKKLDQTHPIAVDVGQEQAPERRPQRRKPLRAAAQQQLLWAFGARVKKLRTARGWTFDDLANAAKLNPFTVQRIEQGQPDTSISVIARIARALKTPIRDLLGPPSTPLSKNGQAMARFLDSVDSAIAASVLRLLRLVHQGQQDRIRRGPHENAVTAPHKRKAGT